MKKSFEDGKQNRREEAAEMFGKVVYNLKLIPKMIRDVPRFQTCKNTRWNLFKQEEAPMVLARTKGVYLLMYGFADASGSCFGSTFLSDASICFRIDTWKMR